MFKKIAACILLASPGLAPTDEIANSPNLRMNHIQIIATHNSYHLRPEEPLFSQVKAVYPKAATWDYSHRPLNEQLDSGVRGFELDLYYNPEGIRVFHVPQFDMNSNCGTFVDCLTVLRDWSRANERHVPIIVLLELKDEPRPEANIPVLPFDAPALEQVEKELLSVFAGDHLLRPDDVRGDATTLNEAIRTKGWPKLDDVRGRVMFVLHTSGEPAHLYLRDGPTLAGRAMFLEAHGDEPHAAVYVNNDPEDPETPPLLKAGFIVRTRADANLREAHENDTTRRDQAFTSGIQVITTDFPPGEPHPETGYVVEFEGGAPARVNSVVGRE